ncbi:MAG: HAD family hydrolase [Candidatus Bathyarchaeia archaeon]
MAKIIAGDKTVECLLLIFDKDGTIVDWRSSLLSLANARFMSIRRLAGEPVANVWAKAVGVNLRSRWIDPEGPFGIAPASEEMLVAASVLYQCGWGWDEAKRLAETAFDDADKSMKPPFGAVPVAGAPEALRRLRALRGLKIALASTDRHWRSSETLKALNLDHYFDVVVGSDDVPKGKPAPDMVLEACRKVGCHPSESVIVGDSHVDMVMGKNAKVKACIGVLSGIAPRDKLEALADIIIPSVASLSPAER